MGFVWDELERRWELTRDALAVYKELSSTSRSGAQSWTRRASAGK